MSKVYQLPHPPSKRLVRFTGESKTADRRICVGDLTDCIQQLPWTPVMSMAVLEVISRRRFVRIGVARAWAADLESKQHKSKARELTKFLTWIESVVIVP